MTISAEHTTSLREIRAFLANQGTDLPPWSAPPTSVERLYQLLRERRGDETFWTDLSDLTRRLERVQSAPLHLDGSDVLSAAVVDQLLADLRADLPDDPAALPSLRDWARSSVGFSAVAAFVLLGASLGCDKTDAECGAAADEDITDAGEQIVICDLVDIINASEMDPDLRSDLLACLPELAAAERADLLDQFEQASEGELADLLEEIAVSDECAGAGDDDTDWVDDDH